MGEIDSYAAHLIKVTRECLGENLPTSYGTEREYFLFIFWFNLAFNFVPVQLADIGISCCGPNKLFRGIGQALYKHARTHNCTTIPIFLGHGIGRFSFLMAHKNNHFFGYALVFIQGFNWTSFFPQAGGFFGLISFWGLGGFVFFSSNNLGLWIHSISKFNLKIKNE